MKLSITSNEFFKDLKEKTGFEGSVRELKEYTKEWLADTFKKNNKRMFRKKPMAFPCKEIPFLDKFSLVDKQCMTGKPNHIITILDEIELMDVVNLWRNVNLEELIEMIEESEDSENKI